MEENHLLGGVYAKMIHLWPRDVFFLPRAYTDKEVVLLYNFDFTLPPFFRKYIFFQSRMCFFLQMKRTVLAHKYELISASLVQW